MLVKPTTFPGDRKHYPVQASFLAQHITLNQDVAIVAIVGEKVHDTPGIAARTFCALSRDNVNIIAIAQGSSESNISFLVPQKDMRAALIATHREFLNGSHSEVSSATGV